MPQHRSINHRRSLHQHQINGVRSDIYNLIPCSRMLHPQIQGLKCRETHLSLLVHAY